MLQTTRIFKYPYDSTSRAKLSFCKDQTETNAGLAKYKQCLYSGMCTTS